MLLTSTAAWSCVSPSRFLLLIIYRTLHGGPETRLPPFITGPLRRTLAKFDCSFTGRLSTKFTIRYNTSRSLEIPPHLRCFATLPCKLGPHETLESIICSGATTWAQYTPPTPTPRNCFVASRRRCVHEFATTADGFVGRNPVYNTAPNGSRPPTGVFTPTTRRNCRQLVANSCTHRRRDATRQFRLVGGVYWALIGLYCKIYQLIGDLPAVILLSWTFFLEWFSCASNLCENSSK